MPFITEDSSALGLYHVHMFCNKNPPDYMYRWIFKDLGVTEKSISLCGDLAMEIIKAKIKCTMNQQTN